MSDALKTAINTMTLAQIQNWARGKNIDLKATDQSSARKEAIAAINAGLHEEAPQPESKVMVTQARCIGPCQTRLRGGYVLTRKWTTLSPQPSETQMEALLCDKYVALRGIEE